MNERILFMAALALLSTGCVFQQGSGQSAHPVVECGVAYRSSIEEDVQDTLTFEMAPDDEEKFLRFEDLTLHARYDLFEYESTTFIIDVLQSGEEAYLTRSLYQLSKERPLENPFIGGHGFTGLTYVQHPQTRAELQFYCSAKQS